MEWSRFPTRFFFLFSLLVLHFFPWQGLKTRCFLGCWLSCCCWLGLGQRGKGAVLVWPWHGVEARSGDTLKGVPYGCGLEPNHAHWACWWRWTCGEWLFLVLKWLVLYKVRIMWSHLPVTDVFFLWLGPGELDGCRSVPVYHSESIGPRHESDADTLSSLSSPMGSSVWWMEGCQDHQVFLRFYKVSLFKIIICRL